MRFVTYEYLGQETFGLLFDEHVLDLQAALKANGHAESSPITLLELIEAGEDVLERIRQIDNSERREQHLIPLSEVRLLAPIPRPRKNIFCVGKNYVEHAQEIDTGTVPEYPILFSKAPTSVIGPEEEIDSHPGVTEQIDYEGELAIVIGKTAKSVRKEDAYEYIFGYTVLNDVSARDKQFRHSQWLLGKSLDTFCPMGPSIVHKSAVPDPQQLKIETRVNGETRQSANTSLMIFDIPNLIATITEGTTLEPGDIIATGTPAGVGMGFQPPRYLNIGDVVEVEIEGLGLLRNRVK